MTFPAADIPSPPGMPWWRHGHVWLLLAGPAAVIAAGLWTAWLAVHGNDPLVDADYYRRGLEINRTLQARADPAAAPLADLRAAERAHLPAVQGRNHAATPLAPPPPSR